MAIGDVDDGQNPALDVIRSACRPIRTVRIDNGSIFDLDDPAENGLFYRLANRLHRTTRRDVIAAQLLFAPGDTLSLQEIEESERLLRASRYIQDAHIEPVLDDDGQVYVTVATTDVWTLMPRLSFSRSGGRNKSSIGVRDANLFGSGSLLELEYASDVDRDGVSVAFSDDNLGASRYALHTSLARNSDGDDTYLRIGKPFYSLDARSANGLTLSDRDQIESFYVAGDAVADYRHQATQVEAFVGRSDGLRDGWTRRLTAGVTLDRHRFSDATSTALPPTTSALSSPCV